MKLTTEQKIIELAKMDGWLDVKEYTYTYDYMGEQGEYKRLQGRSIENLGHLVGLPPYLTSYDAIIPLIQKQDFSIKLAITVYLQHNNKGGLTMDAYFSVTPEQLCDALLRAKGFEV